MDLLHWIHINLIYFNRSLNLISKLHWQIVSVKCLISLNGHLLRPIGISPPCFSFTRFIVEQRLLKKTNTWPLLTVFMRRSRNFHQGGGGGGGGGGGRGEGVQVSLTKKALTTFFFFLVLSLFYRSQMVNFKEIKKSIIFQGSRGGPTFSRGVQLFPGGGGGPIAYSL